MTPWTGEAARLADRIAAFVDGALTTGAPEPFEALLVDVHAWQAAHDPVVAALVEGPVREWTDVPAVPVDLFKELEVGTVKGDAPVVFRTSGTTVGTRGVHRLRSTALYDRGALAWFRRTVPDAPSDVIALLEDPQTAPDSSLSHMVALFGAATWHVRDGVLDRDGLAARVAGAAGPVFLASTAFALAEWFDGDVPALPAGSVVMVTGGFKGRVHRLDDATLYAVAAERLGARVVTEYGMTELSSQLWGAPGEPYRPPPWMRVRAVDPLTGALREPGEPGQLRFYDLCNLDGTVGVETLDEGVVDDDGAVTLMGRLSGAEVRGCSLTIEDAWTRRDR